MAESGEKLQLVVGAKFSTFKEFQDFLSEYHKQERQMFVVGNSQSLTNARVRRKGQKFKEELRYHTIYYVCKFAGSPNSKGLGVRKTSSCKMGCQAHITVGVTGDGNFLEIKTFKSEHKDHEGSEAFFELLPQNKKLGEEKNTVFQLLKLGCDKKSIQDKLVDDFNKHLSRKDIHNLATEMKYQNEDSLDEAVKILENIYGAHVSVLHEANTFKALYFSTKEMRHSMSKWPEIVFIDGTYKLLKNNLTLMILMVEDSVGLSKVVGAALLAREDRVTFQWFLKCFKKENQAACQKMQCMMGDKDLLERDVLKEVFLNVPIYICLFHVLRTFGRTISREQMNITAEERERSLKILDRLAKSSSEDKYNQLYVEFCQSVPMCVQNYFNKNWHPIREEWTRYSMTHGNLGNFTNNRLESLNSKIKQVVKKRSSMVQFVHSFFKWLINRERELLNNLGKNFLKRPVSVYRKDSAEQKYLNLLTEYASSLVLAELRRHAATTIRTFDESRKECSINSHDVTLTVTPTSCECGTWTSMFLPCRHIFAARTKFELPLFVPELCAERWTKAYAFQTRTEYRLGTEYQLDKSHALDPTVSSTEISKSVVRKPHSDAQKRKALSSLTNDLLHTAMLSSHGNFEYKTQVLQEILDYWREGYEVCLTKIDVSGEEKSHNNHSEDAGGYSELACSELACAEQDMANLSINPEQMQDASDCDMGDRDGVTSHLPTVTDPTKKLTDIMLPVATVIKHRSKLSEMTIIKVPKRKKGPIKFASLSDDDKTKRILGWILIDKNIIDNVLSGEYLIGRRDIRLELKNLSDSIANQGDVEVEMLKPYFEKKVFNLLKKAVDEKIELNTWTCNTCAGTITSDCVICESCLPWYHARCVRKVKKDADWFCAHCK